MYHHQGVWWREPAQFPFSQAWKDDSSTIRVFRHMMWKEMTRKSWRKFRLFRFNTCPQVTCSYHLRQPLTKHHGVWEERLHTTGDDLFHKGLVDFRCAEILCDRAFGASSVIRCNSRKIRTPTVIFSRQTTHQIRDYQNPYHTIPYHTPYIIMGWFVRYHTILYRKTTIPKTSPALYHTP